jgi:cytochrome c-type biogenesis protein CcmH/NrfG
MLLLNMDRHEEAAEQFRTFIYSKPGEARGHYQHGVTMFMLDRYDAAEEAFLACLRLDPKYPNVLEALQRTDIMQRRMEAVRQQ